ACPGWGGGGKRAQLPRGRSGAQTWPVSLPSLAITSALAGDDLLVLLAKPDDAEPHAIACLEVDRRLSAHAHARRRAGRDHVARLQHHEARNVGDEMRDAEDHRPGVAALRRLAIHVKEEVQILRIRHLVRRDDPRPEWTEGRRALALDPLTAALGLVFTLRHVVADRVAEHVGKCILLLDIVAPLADDDGELDLP